MHKRKSLTQQDWSVLSQTKIAWTKRMTNCVLGWILEDKDIDKWLPCKTLESTLYYFGGSKTQLSLFHYLKWTCHLGVELGVVQTEITQWSTMRKAQPDFFSYNSLPLASLRPCYRFFLIGLKVYFSEFPSDVYYMYDSKKYLIQVIIYFRQEWLCRGIALRFWKSPPLT